MNLPLNIIVPRGYKTYFETGTPQTAEFSVDTHVTLDFRVNDKWFGATKVSGFPSGRAILFYMPDIGTKLKIVESFSIRSFVRSLVEKVYSNKEPVVEEAVDELQLPFKIMVPAGYKTWFESNQPPVAEFGFDTEVEIDSKRSESWFRAEKVKGFPNKGAVLFFKPDIGTTLKVI